VTNWLKPGRSRRSANSGVCGQASRLRYPLTDAQGGVVAYDEHLLSMKDKGQSRKLEALTVARIRSSKIEGGYNDMGYVKNITPHYRPPHDEIIERGAAGRSGIVRAASGQAEISSHRCGSLQETWSTSTASRRKVP